MVLFSREPIEFETAAYLSVCVMEKSIYVSAGGWDKSFVFYDDGVMNSQNNNNEKSADPIFSNNDNDQTKKDQNPVFFVRSFPPFFERNDYTRSKTHHNNTSIKYLI